MQQKLAAPQPSGSAAKRPASLPQTRRPVLVANTGVGHCTLLLTNLRMAIASVRLTPPRRLEVAPHELTFLLRFANVAAALAQPERLATQLGGGTQVGLVHYMSRFTATLIHYMSPSSAVPD
jgi:hypothetical protein